MLRAGRDRTGRIPHPSVAMQCMHGVDVDTIRRLNAAATGDWVAPLDADDELDPDGVLAAAATVRGWPCGLGWLGRNRLLARCCAPAAGRRSA